jgi:predicted dienelactone hydrolase
MNRIALTIATLALCSGTALGAGFRELTTQGVNVGVWYPSDTPTTAQRLGPFDTVMAKDAPVKSGKFEVVLMSHGLTGRYRNHHLTAQALADVGYIVIGPQHEADYLIGGSKTAQALNHRVTELAKALKGVREDPRFSNSLAASPVHGLGYSLGGATIMLASGAGYSSKKTEQYCSKNQNLDAEFCDDPGWIFRLVQSFKHDVKLAPTFGERQSLYHCPCFSRH